ncbi:iron-containing alcohol dehydrogenase [Geodermatophilus sp. URMC 62]|uniref:iron-containing alcohol dehydrogenase n=1 Tax=Geodermatophilus sp. URMC 62 TaxID=3423414 RepID=UPI00406CA083
MLGDDVFDQRTFVLCGPEGSSARLGFLAPHPSPTAPERPDLRRGPDECDTGRTSRHPVQPHPPGGRGERPRGRGRPRRGDGREGRGSGAGHHDQVARAQPLLERMRSALGSRFVGVAVNAGQHAPAEGVRSIAAELEKLEADAVVGLGGGSVIDSTQVAVASLVNGRE